MPRSTVSTDEDPRTERLDWTSGFLDERLVEPVSPLGWSVLRLDLEDIAFREPLRLLGVDPDELGPITRIWHGHPYVNVATFAALYKLFPDWLLPEDACRFFPGGDVARRKEAPRPSSLFSPRAWAGLLAAFLRAPTVISPFHNDAAWDRFERRYVAAISTVAARIDALQRDPAASLDQVHDLVGHVDAANRELLRIHRWSLTIAEVWYSLLRRVAARLLGPTHGATFAAAAVANLADQSVRLNRHLDELRRIAALGRESDLATALREFLAVYGHRSFSLDLLCPGFAADPTQVLRLLQDVSTGAAGSAQAPGVRGPEDVLGGLLDRRAGGLGARAGCPRESQATRAGRMPAPPDEVAVPAGALRDRQEHRDAPAPIGGASPTRGRTMGLPGAADVILSPLVGLARRSARLREDQRFAWQRGLAQLRRLYLLAGRLLVARGALAVPEDVFFLTSDEVREAASGDAADLRDRADRRRAAYDVEQERFAREGPSGYPPFLRGNWPLARASSLDLGGRNAGMVDRLQGVAVCPGVGRGTARVVRGPSDLTALQAGEVLVTRGADPGWTLVFDRLAALVTESGGQLSHAAVVAREYRLPAVLAVPLATDVIHTGDELVVDGAIGVVEVVSRLAGKA